MRTLVFLGQPLPCSVQLKIYKENNYLAAKGPVIIYDQGGSGVKRLFTENIFAAYSACEEKKLRNFSMPTLICRNKHVFFID